MEEEVKQDNDIEEKKKRLETELLKNNKVNEIIDEKSNAIAEEKAQLLFKRNEFLNTYKNNPLNNLHRYETLDKDEYESIKKSMEEIHSNIAKANMDELTSIENRLRSAASLDERLKSRFESIDISPTPVVKPVEMAPSGLSEILKNPEAYSKYIDKKLSNEDTVIFKTQTDEMKVDLNVIGDRNDRPSLKEMNKLQYELEEILMKNAPFKSYQQII